MTISLQCLRDVRGEVKSWENCPEVIFSPRVFSLWLSRFLTLEKHWATTRPVGCAVPTSSECISCHQAGSNNKGLIIFW